MARVVVGGGDCGASSSFSSSWVNNLIKKKKNSDTERVRVCYVLSNASAITADPYKTLRIQRGASESEVKKAFRQLALQV
ncbi:hypothetical protein LOK49_LG04G02424 [Camellia lanceoleosa]|uniref:Uncharacterized protein n=1 Tax=Camellia lanceoleosa TaxID=1840588 RepID=A0ACC0HVK2_9ERIC|nr:hypothetical protein LOK49_LG04G02424 [Camellia lanceoleosa]